MGNKITYKVTGKDQLVGTGNNEDHGADELVGEAIDGFPLGTQDGARERVLQSDLELVKKLAGSFHQETLSSLGSSANEEITKSVLFARFERWASSYSGPLRKTTGLIKSWRVGKTYIIEVCVKTQSKNFKTETLPSTKKISRPKRSLAALSPWDYTDLTNLKNDSLRIDACENCSAKGIVCCKVCAGSKKATCNQCSGQKKYRQKDKRGHHRLMNCKGCKAKGLVACNACDSGKVKCQACDGNKTTAKWFSVESCVREFSTHISEKALKNITKTSQIGWRTLGTRLFDYDFDGNLDIQDLKKCGCSDNMVSEISSLLSENCSPDEKYVGGIVRVYEVPLAEVNYALPNNKPQSVVFLGKNLLIPRSQKVKGFEEIVSFARRLKWGLTLLPILALCFYFFRGGYFRSLPTFLTLSLIALGAVALYFSILHRKIGLSTKMPKACVGLLSACTLFAALKGEPSVAKAERSFEAGNSRQLKKELAMLSAADPRVIELKEKIQLELYLNSNDLELLSKRLDQFPGGNESRDIANRHLDDVLKKKIESCTSKSDFSGVMGLIRQFPEKLKYDSAHRWAVREVEKSRLANCLAQKNAPCAFETSKLLEDPEFLEEKKDAQSNAVLLATQNVVNEAESLLVGDMDASIRNSKNEKIQSNLKFLEEQGVEVSGALRKKLRKLSVKDGATIEKQNVQREKERIAEKRRQKIEDRKRAKAEKIERREEVKLNRKRKRFENSLRCHDGSFSKACDCGGNSIGTRAGCCNWHGGVAGCGLGY